VAVYTEVTDEALRAFLAQYAIGELLAYRGIAEGVENSNFALKTTQGDFILTLYERRVEPKELPWFLGLMRHLAEQGLSCPQPVAGRDGAALRVLEGRPAAICTFLPGFWPRRVRPSHCAPLGDALAQLHRAGQGFPATRRNGLGPEAWGPLLDRCRADGEAVQPGVIAELDAALAGILAAWPAAGTLPLGHIHADLFPDNVFFLEDDGRRPRVSGLIDFYFACTDLLAYDIAVVLNAWCFEPDHSFNVTKARAILRAYGGRREITQAEWQALPVLCRGASIRFLLTRLYDWVNTPPGAMVTRKDPLEYLHKLRFFGHATHAGAIGA
jgi:homoserine kinase type II